MKTNRGAAARCAAAVVGGLMLAGVGTAALAAEVGDDSVDVNVQIAPLATDGELSLTVAADQTALTEQTSADPAERVFTGTLPDVTVTDTRTDVPEGVFWYVLGQASNFTGDAAQDPIAPDHLGWLPELLTDDGSGNVMVGDEVVTSLDDATNDPSNNNNVGLAGQELLQLSLDSQAAADPGTWTANAALTLKTAATVAAGNYTSVLTLSLFEDEQ